MTATSRRLHPSLKPVDLPALRDLVRFRLMADDQLARRYPDSDTGFRRFGPLKTAGLIRDFGRQLEGAHLYEPTPLLRHVLALPGLRPHTTRRAQVSHDIALVDLADYLVAEHPGLRWVTEDEIAEFLNQIAPPRRPMWGDSRHRPDGLTMHEGVCTAIELEHSPKDETRYAGISKWFVLETRIDRVRWYIDRPRTLRLLEKVNREHAFDFDMRTELVEFPPGVRFRKAPGLSGSGRPRAGSKRRRQPSRQRA